MTYDPFARGPHAVRSSAFGLVDAARDGRALAVTLFHPGARGPWPAVLFSHSSYGTPTQSSFLCEHLASHGYVVVAPEHTGNTAADLPVPDAVPRGPAARAAHVRQMIADRVPDLRFVLDRVMDGLPGVRIDPARIGAAGWSFGGWAALSVAEVDARFGAVVALAPAGSSRPLPGIIPATLTFARLRAVPVLFLAAEHDRFIPAAAVTELHLRAPGPKRMYVLRDADHGHFADRVEPGVCTAAHAHLFTRGLSLAHFDAALRGLDDAARFMDDDPVAVLRALGVEAIAG